MTVKELDREQKICPMVDCAALNCSAVKCAPREKEPPARPACRGGKCVAEALGAAQCRADGDCELVLPADAACRSSPCGCCPGSEIAAPLGQLKALDDKRPPKPGDPKFGLSQGNGASPPRDCKPCPPAKPARAACKEGLCIKVPVFMSR
jgi:hypothetical protein